MIVSMTGYGRVEKKHKDFDLTIEIKSLNSRYLDVHTKLHDSLYRYENDIIGSIRKRCVRGKIYILININENIQSNKSVHLNKKRLNIYMNQINEIKKTAKIDYDISLEYLMKMPDLFESKTAFRASENKKYILGSVDEAINKLINHREKDGKVLQKDILSKIKKINRDLKKIVRLSSSNTKQEFKIIKDKIKNIVPDVSLDSNRLYQEVGLIMEKKDINEELSRLDGHMRLFDEYILNDITSGKKINFLLQEINREVNTIGSKVDNLSIKHMVVDVKNNVEKIREQVQNILWKKEN